MTRQQAKTELLVQIHDLIDGHFDLEEFQGLCFRLGIKYDNLRGENLSTRIQNLVLRLDRERRLDDLLNFCARLRPKVEWPDLALTIALDEVVPQFSAQPRNPRQIFLSHAWQDADFAHQLADDLRHHGWETWIAPDNIHPGEKWVDAINRGLSESGIFVLVITPDAVNSRWVKSETSFAISLQHEGAIRFIPLLVKATVMPPLWQVYEWIPFRVDYKAGLERLLQEIQPEQVSEVIRLYRKLQEAIGLGKWVEAQEIGEQINKLYPDYRETEELIALAQREEARKQIQMEEVAKIYGHLQAAIASADWVIAINLVKQIEVLAPNYRDVKKLKEQARKGQQQKLRAERNQLLHRIPVWLWISGIIVVGALIPLLFLESISGGNSTVTPIATLQVVNQITRETSTATLTPESTITVPDATQIGLPVTALTEPLSTQSRTVSPTGTPSPAGTPSHTPSASTPSSTPTEFFQTPEVKLGITASSVYIRGGPGVAYDTLKLLYEGDEVTVLANGFSDGSWYIVEAADGKQGWLIASATSPLDDISEAFILDTYPVAVTVPPTSTPDPNVTEYIVIESTVGCGSTVKAEQHRDIYMTVRGFYYGSIYIGRIGPYTSSYNTTYETDPLDNRLAQSVAPPVYTESYAAWGTFNRLLSVTQGYNPTRYTGYSPPWEYGLIADFGMGPTANRAICKIYFEP